MSTFNLVIKNLPEKLSEMKDQPQNGSSKSTDMILDNEKTTSTYSFKIDGGRYIYRHGSHQYPMGANSKSRS